MGLHERTDSLADQKKALVRVFLYDRWGLYVTPTVVVECAAIRNVARAELHASWLNTLFAETTIINVAAVDARARALQAHHSGANDCRIVAEAEDAGVTVMLTFDDDMIARLTPHTSLRLVRPLDYWNSLGIAPGSQPATSPHATNPLLQQTWWRW
jgi:predicted nucleic-acid-binding protein